MLKQILLRVLLYPVIIVAAVWAVILIVAAFPWLPAAIFIAFCGLGFLGLVVGFFVNLTRVLSCLWIAR